MKESMPPQWINAIIDRLAASDFAEEIRGDLFEIFLKDTQAYGVRHARRNYIVNGLGFLLKSFFWKKSSNIISPIMLNSYFKMASRSLMAHKSTTIINVLGLVVGIASTLVILSFIRFETSFDKFHSQAKSIYRMVRVSGDDMSEFRSGISYPVPTAIKQEIASIKYITSVEYFGGANVEVPDASGQSPLRFREESGFAFAEPSFFEIFDFSDTNFKWLAGNPRTALKDPMTIVLTRSLAKKYFGDQSVLGNSLKLQNRLDFKVTGLIEDFPSNTDFPFTALISYSTLAAVEGEERMNNWISVTDSHQTFLVLPSNTTQRELESQIAKVHAAHTPAELSSSRHYLLQELGDMHYDARFGTFSGRTISKETLSGLGVVALFLLLTACINYINLATAQSSLRAKEIGLRKVMGSNRSNVVAQYMTETFMIVLIAGLTALCISDIALLNLQNLLEIKHNRYNITDPLMLSVVAIIVIVVTLLAGFYPSIVLSRFNPVTALTNKFTTVKLGGFSLRKVLVVLQFTVTQVLVVGTFIIVSQMEYFSNFNMGFDKEGIINARVPDKDPNVLKGMENRIRSLSFVDDVSFSYTLPGGVRRNGSYSDIGLPEADEMKDYVVYEYVSIDESFLRLYDINLLAGRNLTTADSAGNILINQTLVKALNLGTPEKALGTELKLGGGKKVTVVGVVEDYYSNSLKEGVGHIAIFMEPKSYSVVGIKLNAVSAIEKIWSETFPEFIFSYTFLDENIAGYYKQEHKYASLFKIFAFIFIVIGILGLYGLITFVVNRKSKEVAIRKVLGASIRNILVLFSREYVMLIVISFIIAAPIAYYFVNDWLNNFKNHIPLEWYLFCIPGLAVLGIAMVVISAKSLTAAVSNPVEKLKYE
jgi:putative ABC transport system permease protein